MNKYTFKILFLIIILIVGVIIGVIQSTVIIINGVKTFSKEDKHKFSFIRMMFAKPRDHCSLSGLERVFQGVLMSLMIIPSGVYLFFSLINKL